MWDVMYMRNITSFELQMVLTLVDLEISDWENTEGAEYIYVN